MLTASEQALYDLLLRLTAVEQAGRARIERMLSPGLTLAQLGVLGLLRDGEAWRPHRLASAFGITRQTITTTLARLERAELVAVCRDPADGRSKLVTITEQGAAAHRSCMERLGPVLAMAAERLPGRLAPDLLQSLDQLERALRA